MMPARFVPTICSKTWLTNAYRKVPGDQCESGWTPGQVEVPCPSTGLGASVSKFTLLVVLVVGLAFIGYSKFSPGARGPAANFTWEVSAGSKFSLSNPIPPILGGLRWILSKVMGGNKGFDGYGGVGYKKVQKDDFDLDASINEESLADFIDEAHDDDFAPRVYDGVEEKPLREPATVIGGAQRATEQVPRLQAPPLTASGATSFDIAADEELL